ncbi:hypothetical protein KR009_001383 [Drosophila setifemur]|nr:hypothetical protein KR009_001383 [Drosophila setifemur]
MAKRVKFQHLSEMQPTMTHFCTVALIVSKTTPHIFLDKLSGTERGVLTLTIRDALHQLTNCKCWGQQACVEEYSNMFQIGHVVDIVGAKVMGNSRLQEMPQEQRYQPRATLPCSLVVNEGSGYVVRHDTEDAGLLFTLQQLLHRPVKPLGSALKLADVRSGLGAPVKMIATHVDLLVVLAAVRPLREIKRKLPSSACSDLVQCLELVVIDPSYPDGMLFSVWQADWIRRARLWRPLHTVLHLVDVRVSYSEYHRFPVLSHSNCTLVCEDPQTAGEDCGHLQSFAATLSPRSWDGCGMTELDSLPAVDSIQTQMTVRQIYSRAEGELQDASTDQFTAVLYGLVTKFDLDGLSSNVTRKCTFCQRLIPQNLEDCPSDVCQMEISMQFDGPRCHSYFNINIHFSDQTGTLIETRLAGQPAERILGIQSADFEQLEESKKSELKWRFLLKYVEARLLVKKAAGMRKNLIVVVVDMQPVPLDKLVEKIAVF